MLNLKETISTLVSRKAKPVVILILVLGVTLSCSSPTLTPAQDSFLRRWHKGDLRNPKFKELATYAEKNARDGRERSCIVDHVVSARTMVLNGIMYKISYIAAQTKCRVHNGENVGKCKLDRRQGKRRPCKLLIYEQPDEGRLEFLNYRCGNWLQTPLKHSRRRFHIIKKK